MILKVTRILLAIVGARLLLATVSGSKFVESISSCSYWNLVLKLRSVELFDDEKDHRSQQKLQWHIDSYSVKHLRAAEKHAPLWGSAIADCWCHQCRQLSENHENIICQCKLWRHGLRNLFGKPRWLTHQLQVCLSWHKSIEVEVYPNLWLRVVKHTIALAKQPFLSLSAISRGDTHTWRGHSDRGPSMSYAIISQTNIMITIKITSDHHELGV